MAWRNFITHNLGWKILAVIVATLVWATLRSGFQERFKPGTVRTFTRIPITVMSSASDSRSFRVNPETVEITARIPDSLADGFLPSDLKVFVNLTEIGETEGLRLKIEVHSPPEVAVVNLKPSDVFVEVRPPDPDPAYPKPIHEKP